MKLEKKFVRIKFSSHRLKEIFDFWKAQYNDIESEDLTLRKIDHIDESWSYDTDDEFLSEYSKPNTYTLLFKSYKLKVAKDESYKSIQLEVTFRGTNTTVEIKGHNRSRILKVMHFIEGNLEQFNLPKPKTPKKQELKPVVFIGHGGDDSWRDLKDHLTDQHGIEVVAYETGTRAGHTIRDILDKMMVKSSFAILVMTASDEQADGTKNARPNVIHEVGLFQGKLGFNKAIIALEKGTNLFSNLDGIQQLRFNSNNIKEIFGDVVATIKREFNPI